MMTKNFIDIYFHFDDSETLANYCWTVYLDPTCWLHHLITQNRYKKLITQKIDSKT